MLEADLREAGLDPTAFMPEPVVTTTAT